MNPHFHEEFVELCALFYSGELTDEEWALLQVHMAYCDSCRQHFEEYKYLSKDVIPSMAASAAAASADLPAESAASMNEAERRLMARLENRSKIDFSKKRSWRLFGGIAAGAVLILALAFAHFRPARVRQAAKPFANATAKRNDSAAVSEPRDGDTERRIHQDKDEIGTLRQELARLESQSEKSDAASAASQHQLHEEESARNQVASEKESLSKQLAAAQADIEVLQSEVSSAQANADQRAAHIAELETKMRALNVALDETDAALNDKDRMLALDKDFLAHDRDIRDLIGARNLYIADIYDTTETGKTAKPFGRIFYTQDRSLVFYGFDLEKQTGPRQSVAFQAWGSGSDRQPVSLGLFYQDDSHKRWVVRCNDAKTLARLNMVFVTMEPPGGSSKPTGKQLLRAYLQIQANHP